MIDESTLPEEIRGSLAAMRRAAKMARDIAIQTNTAIIVAVDGKTVHIPAEQLRNERDAESS